jgi:hypothetical protein
VTRREILRVTSACLAALLLAGHSPYRQWKIYRQRYLLLFTMRDDPPSDELGERLAARLRELLPDSRAQVARAPNAQRIASLISSAQADTAVLAHAQALALYRGAGPFADYGAVALRVLAETPAYQLVCREDFKAQHAYLVAEALTREPRLGDVRVPPAGISADQVPVHDGALAFARGDPLPES